MNAFKHSPDLFTSSNFIPLADGVETLYLKVQAIPTLAISFKVLSKEETLKNSDLETLSNGLFFGILLFLLFYNFILYLYTKLQAYLPYLLYILGLLFYFLFINTQYIHILWPYETLSLAPFFQLSMSFVYIGMFLFPLLLLDISSKYPKMYRGIIFMLIALVVMEIILAYSWHTLDFEFYNILYAFESIVVLTLFLILLSLSLHLAVKGEKLALYYFLAWSILFIGLANYILEYSFSVENLFVAQQLFRASVVVEGLLFSFILGYRLKELQSLKVVYEQNILQKNYNQEIGVMLNEVSHQWRQPLNSINAIIFEQIVKDERPQREEWTKTLNEIEDLTSYLSQTIEDFQYPYEASSLDKNFTLKESIDKSLSLISSRLISVTLTKSIDTSVEIYGSMNHLIQVFLIILNNTLNAYSQNNKKKSLLIKSFKYENILTISFEDSAGGISKSVQDTLGDPFVTSKKETGNTGIGLYMAKKILENNFNATLEIVSSSTGTTSTIRLKYA